MKIDVSSNDGGFAYLYWLIENTPDKYSVDPENYNSIIIHDEELAKKFRDRFMLGESEARVTYREVHSCYPRSFVKQERYNPNLKVGDVFTYPDQPDLEIADIEVIGKYWQD